MEAASDELAEVDFELARSAIIRAFPDLAQSRFSLVAPGRHSIAIDVDDRLIFKFPRHTAARCALVREAGLLAVVRPLVSMAVPDISIHPGPPLFSRHEKLIGAHLLTTGYERLTDEARHQLGTDLALFYAQLHRLDAHGMKAAGAVPIETWQTPETIRARALPALPPNLRAFAMQAVAAFEGLAPDPYGTVYGFFDGHGWNMAFDHERSKLNGVYDFADSGFGPLHQEFLYSNLVSPDLTERTLCAYEALTGRLLDRGRVTLLTAIHRLSELAELADDPEHAPAAVRNVAAWAKRSGL